jgi:non-ribosomal peptide synthetase component F
MAPYLHLLVAVMRAVHRIIEQHVVTHGDQIAIVDGDRSCSYRELNSAANALARRMIASGFRRGMQAHVQMPPSIDLAVVLLAVLKTGGCYTWVTRSSFTANSYDGRPSCEITRGDAKAAVAMDDITIGGVCGGPNLPVLTRDTDIACILPNTAGGAVSVPHATILSMASCAAAGQWPWTGEPGAFDLWAALLSRATAVVHSAFALRASA